MSKPICEDLPEDTNDVHASKGYGVDGSDKDTAPAPSSAESVDQFTGANIPKQPNSNTSVVETKKDVDDDHKILSSEGMKRANQEIPSESSENSSDEDAQQPEAKKVRSDRFDALLQDVPAAAPSAAPAKNQKPEETSKSFVPPIAAAPVVANASSSSVSSHASSSHDSGQPIKVHIGQIPFSATESQLHSILRRYGSIKELTMPRDKESGRGRGFGFVTFYDKSSERHLMEDAHAGKVVIDGRVVTANPATPLLNPNAANKNSKGRMTPRAEPMTNRVFVGGLPQVSASVVRAHFERLCRVVECEVPIDRHTGRTRGFGFVTMASEREAMQLLGKTIRIEGTRVEIKRADPKPLAALQHSGSSDTVKGSAVSETKTPQYDHNAQFTPFTASAMLQPATQLIQQIPQTQIIAIAPQQQQQPPQQQPLMRQPQMQPQLQSQLQPRMQPQMQQQPPLQPQLQPQLQSQLQPQLQQQLQPQMQSQLQPQLQQQLQMQIQPQLQQQIAAQLQQQPQRTGQQPQYVATYPQFQYVAVQPNASGSSAPGSAPGAAPTAMYVLVQQPSLLPSGAQQQQQPHQQPHQQPQQQQQQPSAHPQYQLAYVAQQPQTAPAPAYYSMSVSPQMPRRT